MATLGSGSWTIAGAQAALADGRDIVISDKKKFVSLKLTLAAGEFPAAGVPLPSAGSIGLVRNLDYYILSMPRLATASGKIITFSLTTGNKYRAYTNALMSGTGRSVQALATAITVPSQIVYATAVGW